MPSDILILLQLNHYINRKYLTTTNTMFRSLCLRTDNCFILFYNYKIEKNVLYFCVKVKIYFHDFAAKFLQLSRVNCSYHDASDLLLLRVMSHKNFTAKTLNKRNAEWNKTTAVISHFEYLHV